MHVDGAVRADGFYDADGDGQNDIQWVPSVGWEFNQDNWDQWREIRIQALQDDDDQDTRVVFTHDVWDHTTNCPVHGVGRVEVRVVDDELAPGELPTLSIGDAEVREGRTARFPVTLNAASTQDVTVRYRTSNGTAQAGSDYDAVNDTLTFLAGAREHTIEVQTTEDGIYEGDETFTVRLSSPSAATLQDGIAEGTIADDDPLPRLSIGNATVEEGGTAAFEVTLLGERAVTATVRYSTVDGTAVRDSDYTAIDGGTLTFRPGDDSETIRVRTREDGAREDSENFTVVLSEPEEATLDFDTGIGTITDDDADALPSLRVGDTTVREGATATFTVTLSAESVDPVTIGYETRGGTALADSDYTSKADTLTFSAGTTDLEIQVVTLQDQDYEGDETFTVRLSNPSGATLDDGTGTGTIQDNDDPGLSINDVTVREGSPAQFTVTLEGPTDHDVTVQAATSDGAAVAGDDYTAKSERLTIPARQTTATFSVDTLADEEQDSNETFTVTLSSPSGATLDDADATGTGTITEGGGGGGGGGGTTPRLSIDDASVGEGDAAEFTVTLSRTSNRTVTVDVQTANDTAEAGADYTAKSETLTIAAGQTTATFSVDTIDDQDQESDENFTVTLSNPSGARLDDDTGTGTITDDDTPLPALSIDDAAAEEGETVQLTVTLTGTVTETVTVDFRTSDDSATTGADYEQTSGMLTFSDTDRSRTISVATIEDTIREADESFSVTLYNPAGATLADDTATGTITDDDDTALPALSIDDAAPVTEGGTAEFVVTLSAESQQAVTVSYATADGTAVEDADYTSASGTLSFQPGERTKTISVATIDDDEQESEEHFTVTLGNPDGATLEDSSGRGAITDDDGGGGTTPTLSIADASAEEGETVQLTVTLTGDSNQTVTVDFRTTDGTAKAGSDYDQTSGTLTFTAGDRTKTISVATIEDIIREADESFSVTLSNPAGATPG